MVFIKHNSLKSDIFVNPIFIPGFSGSSFFKIQVFRVQVFQGPGQGPSPSFRSSHPKKLTDAIYNINVICKIERGSVGCSVPQKQSPAAVL